MKTTSIPWNIYTDRFGKDTLNFLTVEDTELPRDEATWVSGDDRMYMPIKMRKVMSSLFGASEMGCATLK